MMVSRCIATGSALVHNFLSLDDCQMVSEARKEQPGLKAQVIEESGGKVDMTEHRSCLNYFWKSKASEALIDRVHDQIQEVNTHYWNLKISPKKEAAVTIVEYNKGDRFNWHQDWSAIHEENKTRWLSAVIQISDPATYVGGDLDIYAGPDIYQASRAQGDLIIFPSFMYHRVTPVLHGQRVSLITWLFLDGQ